MDPPPTQFYHAPPPSFPPPSPLTFNQIAVETTNSTIVTSLYLSIAAGVGSLLGFIWLRGWMGRDRPGQRGIYQKRTVRRTSQSRPAGTRFCFPPGAPASNNYNNTHSSRIVSPTYFFICALLSSL